MPWSTQTPMSQRLEFVVLATGSRLTFSELCRRFGVSRKTGYKWLERYKSGGGVGRGGGGGEKPVKKGGGEKGGGGGGGRGAHPGRPLGPRDGAGRGGAKG